MAKVAVVTGAARGLGRAICFALASEGYSLAIHYNTSNKEAKELVLALKKTTNADCFKADLTREEQVDEMFAAILKKFGKIDVLVNNVGNFLYKKFSSTSNAEFRDILETNIYSTLYCSRKSLEYMRKAGFGHIINIGAVGCERFTLRENSIPYFLAKNGIYVLTKTMAWEEAKNGVHINMVSPASMQTDIFASSDFPMAREAKHEDVISAILFLLSKKAYYINGCNLEVAGGFIPGMK